MSAAGAGLLALLDSLTFPEVLAILVIALVVLGPEKLPSAARSLGEWTARLRALTANLESEVREVLDDPSMQPIRELGEFAAQPRRKLAEYARAAAMEDDHASRRTPSGPEVDADAVPAAPDAATATPSVPEEPQAVEAPPAIEAPAAPEAHRDGAETGPDAQ